MSREVNPSWIAAVHSVDPLLTRKALAVTRVVPDIGRSFLTGVALRDWCADTIARMKLVHGLLTMLLLLTLAQPARPQARRSQRAKPAAPASESGLFKADVKLILIPVSVTDENGATVTSARASSAFASM